MNLRAVGLFIGLAFSSLICLSCGGSKSATVSQPVTGTVLTTVSLGDDVTVHVPAGALPDGSTVNVVKGATKNAAPSDLEGGKSVGAAYRIDIGDQKLAKPVTVDIAFDPKLLPSGAPKDSVFLAYYDDQKQQWVPVGGQVDSQRNVVSIQTDHLSWWNPFSWNWDAWGAILKDALSGKLSDWVKGFQLLTTDCKESGQYVEVDNSKGNDVIKGCIQSDNGMRPEVRIINLKSFDIGVSGGKGMQDVASPGDAVIVTTDRGDVPPLTFYADFTEPAMWRFVAGLVAEMLPDGGVIPNEGLAFIADGLKNVASLQDVSEKLGVGDYQGAAEGIYGLITGGTFIETFLKLAVDYGQKNGIDMMTKWTEAGVKAVLSAGNAVSAIVSTTDFLVNYALNNHSAVSFSWMGQVLNTPSSAEGSSAGEGQGEYSAHEVSDDYESNLVAARAKYEGRTVKLTGEVYEIGEDAARGLYIQMGYHEFWEFWATDVYCLFAKSETAKVAKLSRGDAITVTGRVGVGSTEGSIWIEGCTVD